MPAQTEAGSSMDMDDDDGEGEVQYDDDDGAGVAGLQAITVRRGRKYIQLDDPRTGTLSEGRIEISPKKSGKVIISFPPYLDTGNASLLPEQSRQSGFRRRPSYAFKKTHLGIKNEAPEVTALSASQLKDLIGVHGRPTISMAPWVYPMPAQGPVLVWLKLEWPGGNRKEWASRTAWNGAIGGGDGSITSFWDACAQLKPPTDRARWQLDTPSRRPAANPTGQQETNLRARQATIPRRQTNPTGQQETNLPGQQETTPTGQQETTLTEEQAAILRRRRFEQLIGQV
jgi:hypothetical protein